MANVTRCASICALLVVGLWPRSAAGQEPLGPEPVAAELFLQGRELIKKGDWINGCAKLELSMKRYPAPSTLMNIARCREHDGRLATAWALYRRALVLNLETDGDQRKQELDDVANAAIAALEPRLPRIRVVMKPAVRGARVSEGGRELPLGTAVPLDAGSYEVVANAPGHVEVQQRVELQEGQTTEIELTLKPEEQVVPEPNVAEPSGGDEPTAEPGVPVWVWLVGGSGIVMSGLAIGFGIDSKLTADGLEERCGADLVCDEDLAFDPDEDNARQNRGLGLAIGFGVGALGAFVASTIGLVSNVNRAGVAWVPMVTPDARGIVVTGSF